MGSAHRCGSLVCVCISESHAVGVATNFNPYYYGQHTEQRGFLFHSLSRCCLRFACYYMSGESMLLHPRLLHKYGYHPNIIIYTVWMVFGLNQKVYVSRLKNMSDRYSMVSLLFLMEFLKRIM